MTVNRTTLLDLPLPVTGTESGTWGDTTNNGLTQYMDIAIAGTLVLSTDADVTLTSTEGDSSATNIGATTAQYAILRWTATGSTTRNITALAQSKTYVVINATGGTQSIVLRGAGPTAGVTIVAGEKAYCAWNGSDFVKVGGAAGGSTTQVQYNNAGVFAGSSNLTFDGTNLTSGGTVTATKLIPTGNVTAGNGMYLPTTNTLAFSTDGSERMRISSAGNVGIGDSSPGYKLTVASNTLIYTDSVSSNNYSLTNGGTNYGGGVAPYLTVAGAGGSFGYLLIKGGDGGTSNTANMAFANKNSAGNYILGALIACNVTTATAGSEVQVFRIAVNSGGTVTDRMRINADGTIKTSATISVGDATPSTSGAGITFPATQSASSDANTLDDYEEGTWTPSIAGTTTAGTASYVVREANYTKIGNLVYFSLFIDYTSGTGTGNTKITGLPFSSSSSNVDINPCTVNVRYLTYTGDQVIAYTEQSSSAIVIAQQSAANYGEFALPYDSGANFGVSGFYQV